MASRFAMYWLGVNVGAVELKNVGLFTWLQYSYSVMFWKISS